MSQFHAVTLILTPKRNAKPAKEKKADASGPSAPEGEKTGAEKPKS